MAVEQDPWKMLLRANTRPAGVFARLPSGQFVPDDDQLAMQRAMPIMMRPTMYSGLSRRKIMDKRLNIEYRTNDPIHDQRKR